MIKMILKTVLFETVDPTLNIKLVQISILSLSVHFSAFIDAAVQKPYIVAPEKPCECGKSLTLTCVFERGTFAIEWLNSYDATLIAHCVQNVCELNPKYYGQYDISVDLPRCVFNLTVTNVTMEDDSRRLMCSDGSQSDSKIIKVREYEPMLLEDSNYGVIKATSGCVSNEKEVTFKWIKKVNENQPEEEANPKLDRNFTKDCPTCGNDEQKQYTEIINAQLSENGYNLKVIAFYGNESKESTYSVDKYIIEKQDEEYSNTYILCTIVTTLAVFTLIAIIAAVYLIKRRKMKTKHVSLPKPKHDEENLTDDDESQWHDCNESKLEEYRSLAGSLQDKDHGVTDLPIPNIITTSKNKKTEKKTERLGKEVSKAIDEANTHAKKATVSLLHKSTETDRRSGQNVLVGYGEKEDQHCTDSGFIEDDELQRHDYNESRLKSEENRPLADSLQDDGQSEPSLPSPNISTTKETKKTEKKVKTSKKFN